jgi:hypothetical protein
MHEKPCVHQLLANASDMVEFEKSREWVILLGLKVDNFQHKVRRIPVLYHSRNFEIIRATSLIYNLQ